MDSGVDLAAWIFSTSLILPPMTRSEILVEVNGIEPMTSCLQSRCSPN